MNNVWLCLKYALPAQPAEEAETQVRTGVVISQKQ